MCDILVKRKRQQFEHNFHEAKTCVQESDAGSNHFGSEHEKLFERLLDDPFKQEAC